MTKAFIRDIVWALVGLAGPLCSVALLATGSGSMYSHMSVCPLRFVLLVMAVTAAVSAIVRFRIEYPLIAVITAIAISVGLNVIVCFLAIALLGTPEYLIWALIDSVNAVPLMLPAIVSTSLTTIMVARKDRPAVRDCRSDEDRISKSWGWVSLGTGLAALMLAPLFDLLLMFLAVNTGALVTGIVGRKSKTGKAGIVLSMMNVIVLICVAIWILFTFGAPP